MRSCDKTPSGHCVCGDDAVRLPKLRDGARSRREGFVRIALGSAEAPYLGNEDGVMATEKKPGKPTPRRYSEQEKAQAVRLVRQLRAELGTDHGTESVRAWVRQADIDEGVTAGITTVDAERIKRLEQENRELRRANAILRS